MTKTAAEVVTQAHRYLNVLSVDETVSEDQEAYGAAILDGLLAEAVTVQGLTIGWTVDEVPDGLWLALSRLLAADMAAHYERPFEPLSRAWGRFRAGVNPSNLPDRRDADEDGVISEAEAIQGQQAAYY